MTDMYNGVIDASTFPSLQAAADACFGQASNHQGPTAGFFADWMSGYGEISNVRSVHGQVAVEQNSRLKVGGFFDRPDWLLAQNLWPNNPSNIDPGSAAIIDVVRVKTQSSLGAWTWIAHQHIISDGAGNPVVTGS